MVSPWIPRSADDFVLDFNPDPALIHDRLKTEEMARLGRFERPTSGSGDQRSIQLSYRRAMSAPPFFGGAQGAGTAIRNIILSGLAGLCQGAFASGIFGRVGASQFTP